MEVSVDCQHPVICSMMQPKQCCQACLRGIHDPNNCFLRGPAFRPAKLNQRINNYNQQFGDKPPKGHVPPDYKPLGIPPMHEKKSSLRPSKFTKKPFSGSTKIKVGQQKSSIHAIEQVDDVPNDVDPPCEDSDTHPYLGSFVKEEESFYDDNKLPSDDDVDIIEPTICLMHSLLSSAPSLQATNFTKESYQNTNITDLIHPNITSTIQKYHQRRSHHPCGNFVCHHHDNLQRIPREYFDDFCEISLMADGGANVWAITDCRCFYFYIPQESSITQAGGSGMPSKAWDGVLTQFGNKIYLVAPVYHFPGNPRNTYSPGVLIDFCHFQRVVIDTHRLVDMQDTTGVVHQLPISVHNNLDYVTIRILTLKPISMQPQSLDSPPVSDDVVPPTICSQAITTRRRSPRLLEQELQSLAKLPLHQQSSPSSSDISESAHVIKLMNPRVESQQEYIVPKEALMTIIHFYIDLHPAPSPRSVAIQNINLLLGNHVPSKSYHHIILCLRGGTAVSSCTSWSK
jgi:hypothetical protein